MKAEKRLAVAIDKMPKNQRLLLSLMFKWDLTLPECAEVLEKSVPTIRKLYAKTIKDLYINLRSTP